MVKVIVVSHGDYSRALIESSQLIMGELSDVTAFGFYLGESIGDLRQKIETEIQKIQSAGPDDEILVLTDMKSGSPFNVVAMLMQDYAFHHLAGTNLPIFLEIMGTRDFCSVQELCEMATTEGKETIVNVNKMMEEL